MTLEELLGRLHGVRRSGTGYVALCPAHDDRQASLSVNEDNGRLLLHCHAGCAFPAIRDALGLTNADLRTTEEPAGQGAARIVATYDYLDERGALLYQVVRYAPKTFRQRRPDGAGGWVWRMGNTRRVLYRLPEVLAADPARPVYLVEGEKSADRLARDGLVATCSPGGAGKWRDAYGEALRGRRVVILPDNDDPGRSHALQAARSLFGVAASVRLLALPGLSDRADVYDFLQDGHTVQDLDALAAEAPEWTPEADADAAAGQMAALPPTVRDLAHAEALAVAWRGRYRWAAHRGTWLQWTGQRWAPVTDGQAASAAAADLRRHYAGLLAEARDREAIERLATLVTETCRFSCIQGGLNFLKGFEGFHTDAGQWDRDPWLLNVANGTIDLRSGQVRPHDPADMITKLAPVDFAPGCAGDAWEAHLAYFLPSDDVRRQVQRDLGMAMVGADLDEMLPVWYGTGANGKSTTARVIQEVLGDYACRAAPNLLIQQRHEQHPTELADLAGQRVVFSVEVGNTARLDESKTKDLTGGDRIKARYMRQDFFEFESTWTIFLLCNHKPTISGTDLGIWRRVRLVPWTVTIPPEEQRPQDDVVRELMAEGPAVLAWLLAGLADWQRDRHWRAAAVQEATEAYRAEEDRLAGFLAECCEQRPYVSVPVGELYEAYAAWCTTAGEEALGKHLFGERLRDRGITQARVPGGKTRSWVGVRLVTKCDNRSQSSLGKSDFREERETLSHFVTGSEGDHGQAPASGIVGRWGVRPEGLLQWRRVWPMER